MEEGGHLATIDGETRAESPVGAAGRDPGGGKSVDVCLEEAVGVIALWRSAIERGQAGNRTWGVISVDHSSS